MKLIKIGVLSLSLLTVPGVSFKSLAAAADREGLPPGLQKKDKLPPGWQKKQGKIVKGDANEAPASVTNVTASPKVPPIAPPPPPTTPTAPDVSQPKVPGVSQPKVPETVQTPTTPPAVPGKPLTKDQRENLTRMERALSDLEKLAARPGASDRMLQRLSNRQNIPAATLQSQLKSNPGLTVPQLYLATMIAKEGKVPADQVLRERKSGMAWGDIARSHKVAFNDMTDRLRGAEEVAQGAADAEQNKARREQRRN